MKGGEERRNREAASRYLITRTLCKIRRVSKINIRLELMFVSRSKHEEFEENSSANFVNILPREYLRNIYGDILLQLARGKRNLNDAASIDKKFRLNFSPLLFLKILCPRCSSKFEIYYSYLELFK